MMQAKYWPVFCFSHHRDFAPDQCQPHLQPAAWHDFWLERCMALCRHTSTHLGSLRPSSNFDLPVNLLQVSLIGLVWLRLKSSTGADSFFRWLIRYRFFCEAYTIHSSQSIELSSMHQMNEFEAHIASLSLIACYKIWTLIDACLTHPLTLSAIR